MFNNLILRDMKLYSYLNSKISIIGMLILALGLTSCGSYQYASYDYDGIYGEPEKSYEIKNVEYKETGNESENSAYYKNYFNEKATQLDYTGDAIFTDIDAYQGSYGVENDSLNQENYAGWGYSDDITVNIYNRAPLYDSFWYPGYGWYNDWNFGYGYYGYSNYWYSPFYSGWGSPWYYGYGYGYPYYGYGYGYGYGYPYYGYNNFYYGNIYNRRNLSYSASRRGSIYANNNISGITNRRSGITNRRSSINSRATNLRNNALRSSRSRVNATRFGNSRVNSQSRPTRSSRFGNTSNTRSRSSTTRSGRSSTSRSSSTRSNNNSSRRSNNVSSSNRSSSNSSSTRSSGSRSSSSRRGNN